MRLKRRQGALAYVWYRPGPKWATVSGRGGSLDHAHSPTNTRRIARTYKRQHMDRWNGGTDGDTLSRSLAGKQATGRMITVGRIAEEANADRKLPDMLTSAQACGR